jgi:hypothetical protein
MLGSNLLSARNDSEHCQRQRVTIGKGLGRVCHMGSRLKLECGYIHCRIAPAVGAPWPSGSGQQHRLATYISNLTP